MKPRHFTTQQPAADRRGLLGSDLLTERVAGDIGRELEQQLADVSPQGRTGKAHTGAKMSRQSLPQARRRAYVLRGTRARPEVDPRALWQVCALEIGGGASRYRLEPAQSSPVAPAFSNAGAELALPAALRIASISKSPLAS